LLLVDDVTEASRFYVDHLGFRPTAQLAWFVSLAHRERPECMLDFVRRDHESMPEAFRDRPSSVLLAFVVPDATREYTRLREAGLRIVEPLRDQPWGQRRFIGVDSTGGVMIEVLEVIGPPSPEFLAQNP
jgi:catechol 2,3-dioxygenase-like lactoylglutathione lyase family enzyme